MADDPNTPPATGDPNSEHPLGSPRNPHPNPSPEPKPNDIAAMEAALKKANREAEDGRKKLKEFEDRDKSESDKLADRIAAAEKRAGEAEARALRLEVAAAKGLTPTQAKRLVGATQEELEADADELLLSFPAATPATPPPPPPPGGKAREELKPAGSNPDAPVDETDVKKLGERMFT